MKSEQEIRRFVINLVYETLKVCDRAATDSAYTQEIFDYEIVGLVNEAIESLIAGVCR